jgi:hypothetical protein
MNYNIEESELIDCLIKFEANQSKKTVKRKLSFSNTSPSKCIKTENFIESFFNIHHLMNDSQKLFCTISNESKKNDFYRVLKKVIAHQNRLCELTSFCLSQIKDCNFINKT